MRRLRSTSVWILLATLVVGGVVAPSLHRLQHAAERVAVAADEACHSPAIHNAEIPLWTEQEDRVEEPDCELCARRLLIVQPVLGPAVVPGVRSAVQTEVRSHIASVQTSTDRFIRGPPSPFGPRLV